MKHKCDFWYCKDEGEWVIPFPSKQYPSHYCEHHLKVLKKRIESGKANRSSLAFKHNGEYCYRRPDGKKQAYVPSQHYNLAAQTPVPAPDDSEDPYDWDDDYNADEEDTDLE